ncbi:MAG: DUF4331 domain-containing protein [Gammaproteobacteria bacterium]|nr:DUF4331 domain-containing protein [Gammaproteobacteria bacterium]
MPAVNASSHREAPFITEMPAVDNTDVYAFRSYEPGREHYVTLLANFIPFQDPYGGPNFYPFDEDALYEVNIDNDGDAVEDITYQFQFDSKYRNATVPTGPGLDGAETDNAVAVINTGTIEMPADADLNRVDTYTVKVARDGAEHGKSVVDANSGKDTFITPIANIGQKSIADYAGYAQQHVYDVALPGCHTPARLFVGQRREGFFFNVGEIFDLINLDPLGSRDSGVNILDGKNINTLALEVPTKCLVAGDEPVIGTWATASLPETRTLIADPTVDKPEQTSGDFVQVSRLGSPLVNEVVIGVPDKDLFNASEPQDDVAQFAGYVTNPTLPVLANTLFGTAVPATPRVDLVQAFITGIPGLTQPANVDLETFEGAGEMLRLNTAVPVTPLGSQQDLGFLACDLSGFPNGRRPMDDVVDIELSAALGAVSADNPNALQTCA